MDFVEVIVEAMLQRRLAFIHELPRRGVLGNSRGDEGKRRGPGLLRPSPVLLAVSAGDRIA